MVAHSLSQLDYLSRLYALKGCVNLIQKVQ